MGVSCLICEDQNMPRHSVNFTAALRPEIITGNVPSGANSILSRHLHIVFILRNVLELPTPKLAKILRNCPNFLEERSIICERCDKLVGHCKRIYGELLEVSRKFQNTKLEIVKIMKKRKRKSVTNRKKMRDTSGTIVGTLEECRHFVVNYEYGQDKIVNPFLEGDLQARNKIVANSNGGYGVTDRVEDIVKDEVESGNEDSDAIGEELSSYVDERVCTSSEDEEANHSNSSDEDWNPGGTQKYTRKQAMRTTKPRGGDEVEDSEQEIYRENLKKVKRKTNRSLKSIKSKNKKLKTTFRCPYCETYGYFWISRASRLKNLCYHLDECGLKNNGRNQSMEEVTQLICNFCSEPSTADDIPSFVNHLLTCYYKHNIPGVQKTSSVPVDQRVFTCNICIQMNKDKQAKFFHLDKFLEHYTDHQWFSYECSQCGERYLNIDDSHVHWTTRHKDLLDSEFYDGLSKSPYHFKIENKPVPNVTWWCAECGDMFHSESERNEHMQAQHDAKLEEILKEKCCVCGKFYGNPDELNLHQITTHALEMKHVHQCEECAEVFLKEERLFRHKSRNHNANFFKCDLCDMSFMYKESLAKHRRDEHKIMGKSEDIGGSKCTQTFSTKDDGLMEHEACDESIRCNVCSKVFSTKESMTAHRTRAHAANKDVTEFFPCTVEGCELIFNTRAKLRRHIPLHRVFRCRVCGKDFGRKQNKERHEREVHKLTDRDGGVCPFQTDHENSLQTHQTNVHGHDPISEGEKDIQSRNQQLVSFSRALIKKSHVPAYRQKPTIPTSCKVKGCSQVFQGLLDYRIHMKIHTASEREQSYYSNRLKFLCPEEGCEKAFQNKWKVKYHLAQCHGKGEAQFVCDACGKRFYMPDYLRRHKNQAHGPNSKPRRLNRRTLKREEEKCKVEGCSGLAGVSYCAHKMRARIEEKKQGIITSKEQFVCDTCGKVFSSMGWLDVHRDRNLKCKLMRMSEAEVFLPCHICGKQLSSQFGLDKHVRERHEGKFSFYCEHCGKGFDANPRLKRHLAVVHKIGEFHQKKYMCPWEGCGKMHMNKSWLEYCAARHRKEEPRFKCDQCDKGFYFPVYLSHHRAVVHRGYRIPAKRSTTKTDDDT